MIRRFLCKLGLHRWDSYVANWRGCGVCGRVEDWRTS
jgi:hypothetical protein